MTDAIIGSTVFVTSVQSAAEIPHARLLIESIRTFGGDLNRCPIWLFDVGGHWSAFEDLEAMDVQSFPLSTPDTVRHYLFAEKVYACAQAEELAAPTVQSLVWIDPGCLIIRPPEQFILNSSFDAAVRPVHIKNVGILSELPLDGFWSKIAMNAGVADIEGSVETFIDGRRIRPYFNSHAFAVDPSRGLLQTWFERFETLVGDDEFQRVTCRDQTHQIFLHQAVLSVLLAISLDSKRIRLLPPDYNYPYNLHQSVPIGRRAKALNDLVCIAYERRRLDPNVVDDIEIHDPLRSWLLKHATPS